MNFSLPSESIQRTLDSWFSQAKRAFPWRENPTPYAVLVSEVMLQQTQASRVLLYFSRWMERFPSLEVLGQASEEEVIKAWEGLGYYRRARALHKAAKILVQEHGGIIPDEREALLQIPGIGPYTAGAILSFAFHKKALAIDANVERVMRRLCGISYDDPQGGRHIESCTEALLPEENAWHTMEALIELGALVCNKKPACSNCPLSSWCHSLLRGAIELPPPKALPTHLYRDVACIIAQDSALVLQRTGKEVMSGLYEFPYFDSFLGGRSGEEFLKSLRENHDLHLSLSKKLHKVVHSFTRFRAHLHPWIFLSHKKFSFDEGTWVSIKELPLLPFSSGHKRICSQILEK